MERELHAHGGPHVVEPVGERHEQRGRAHAVTQRLDAPGAGDPPDLGDRLGPVGAGDVVEGETVRADGRSVLAR